MAQKEIHRRRIKTAEECKAEKDIKTSESIDETVKPKRRTHTSSTVKARYEKKTYKSYNIKFRIKEDADLIDIIEQGKKKWIKSSRNN